MAEIWKPQDKSVYKDWIETLRTESSDDLTIWETNFIDSLDVWLETRNLSFDQARILEKIYAEKTK